MSELTITHDGIVITYDERDDLFHFTLRGIERSSDSLRKAKQAIDKPAPKDKKAFTPIQAWFCRWSRDPEMVTITSLVEKTYREQQVWIKNSKGQRSKEGISNFKEASESNAAIIESIRAASKEIERITESRRSMEKSLTPLQIDTTPEV